jgi:hypothetical protein
VRIQRHHEMQAAPLFKKTGMGFTAHVNGRKQNQGTHPLLNLYILFQ